jgi:hypothetical protein
MVRLPTGVIVIPLPLPAFKPDTEAGGRDAAPFAVFGAIALAG